MIVGIHQPQYLAWSGYFNKMANSDVFVILDDVDYKPREWQNRNRIPAPEGSQWLTVPTNGKQGDPILDVNIDTANHSWQRKQIMSLETVYSPTPYFNDYFPTIRDIINAKFEKMIELNMALISKFQEWLDIKCKVVYSSALPITSTKTERLVQICRALSASVYVTGKGALEYLEPEKFQAANMTLVVQQFSPPVYPQSLPRGWNNKSFRPAMSIVDVLFNCGPESGKIISKGWEVHT